MKYYVTEAHDTGDEFTLEVTEDRAKAVEFAQDLWSRWTKGDRKHNTLEVRIYAKDIEDEDCDDYSYDTVDWYTWYAVRHDTEEEEDTTFHPGSADRAEADELLRDWQRTWPGAYLVAVDLRTETVIERI